MLVFRLIVLQYSPVDFLCEILLSNPANEKDIQSMFAGKLSSSTILLKPLCKHT